MRRQFLSILMLEHTQHCESRLIVIIMEMIRRVNLRTFLLVILHILNKLQSILIHQCSSLRYRIGETFIGIEYFLLIFVFQKINLSLNLISSELEISIIIAWKGMPSIILSTCFKLFWSFFIKNTLDKSQFISSKFWYDK